MLNNKQSTTHTLHANATTWPNTIIITTRMLSVSALVAKAAAAHKAKVAKKGGKQGTLGGFVQHKHRRKHQRTANNGSSGGGGGSATASSAAVSAGSTSGGGGKSHSGKFSEYCDLCEHVMAVSSQTAKTAIIRKFVDGFTGNLVILFRLLLPTLDKRVYNMKVCNPLSLKQYINTADPHMLFLLVCSKRTWSKCLLRSWAPHPTS